LHKQGHDVRLIAAQFVEPFVKSNKNDFVDAEAIAEAVERKNMRFVPIKTDEQLDLQAIHRVRDRLISRRTAVINQLRAFLLERGLVFAKTPAKLRAALPEILENADLDLTTQMRNLIDLLWNEWKTVEDQIKGLCFELERISAADPGCTRIRKIPGIGPIVATAIVAAIGNGVAFRKGPDLPLGSVSCHDSIRLEARRGCFGISKRDNVYLRKILTHGVRAAVLRIKRGRAPIGACWLRQPPLARGTCAKIRNIMGVLFNHACRYELYSENPIRLVRQSSKRRRIPHILHADEIKRLLDGVGPLTRLLIFLDVTTGLRQSELFGLRWSDLDFDNGEISVVRSVVHGVIQQVQN
jgi:transposase